jgi:nitronate monooxygenase
MWNKNRLTQALRIRFPLIQAPMAGITTPRLVAAVSNAGGLGSLAAAYLSPEKIKQDIDEVRALTEQPFAVNLFAPSDTEKDIEREKLAYASLSRFRAELDIPVSLPKNHGMPSFNEQVSLLLEEKIPVFSFTFGTLPLQLLAEFKRQGTFLMGTATTRDEALLLEMSGVDAIVAQGAEAGGHRATFLSPSTDPLLTMPVLCSLLLQSCKTPIIATGGIMNGSHIASALALGIHGVQLGTAFIACAESGASPGYKSALLQSSHAQTVLTACFSGKTARAIENQFTREMHNAPLAAFPCQHFLTQDIRTAAAKSHRPEFLSLYAGQGFPLATNLSASEIIPLLIEQTIASIHALSAQI